MTAASLIAGIPAILLGALVYVKSGLGDFLSAALAVLIVFTLCAAGTFFINYRTLRVSPLANRRLIAVLLVIGILVSSLLAGLFDALNDSTQKLTRRRPIVFLIDKSGSMDGEKDVSSRKAVLNFLEGLPENQLVSASVFSDDISYMNQFNEKTKNTAENRKAIEGFLQSIAANGGSSGITGLGKLLDRVEQGVQIIMVTDAVLDDLDAGKLRSITDKLKDTNSVFSGVLISDTPNVPENLKSLAEESGGAFVNTSDIKQLDNVLEELYHQDVKLFGPVTDLKPGRLIVLCVLALLIGLTYYAAFGRNKGFIIEIIFAPVLMAVIYILLWKALFWLPEALCPALLLLPYAVIVNFYREANYIKAENRALLNGQDRA